MFRGKQGGNTTCAQNQPINGVRQRIYKDLYHVSDVDGKLQLNPLQQEKIREIIKINTPTSRTSSPMVRAPFKKAFSATTDLSMISNTAFGISNETHASPFYRKLKGGWAMRAKATDNEPPSRPDSVRSEDFVSSWDTCGSSGTKSVAGISQKQFLDVSKKFPPHMQHHHHFGWGDAHITTSLYKPRNDAAQANRDYSTDKLPGKMNSVQYCAKVRSQYTTISKCPTTNNLPKRIAA